MATIDHLVYAVPNLEKGIAEFENKFGIQATIGGKHLTKGTHNALINLGKYSYLEIIAVDPENWAIQQPRWMGVDLGDNQSLFSYRSSKCQQHHLTMSFYEHHGIFLHKTA